MSRFLVLAAVLACGCNTANPTSFPWWGFPGTTTQTHAKPGGSAYFRNFDPKACRLELTPTNASCRPGGQQVLVATVYDKDGVPRRKRRVEWIVEGPGNIVELDESGIMPGRGYKVDNKYGVSYTDYFEHTITRGNDDPRDDFTVRPGQTWCVITSAVEGQTTVTAYAPGVYNWDAGRVSVKVLWADTNFNFPPPVISSRSGGEVNLSTVVSRNPNAVTPAEPLRVRYRIIDGPPASLVSQSGAGTTATFSGTGQKEAEVATDADGKATVKVIESAASPGKTRVAVEVVKPDPGGVGAGTVVGRQETTVEWAAASLALDVKAPKAVAVGREVAVPLVLANTGKADSRSATVRATLPDGAEFVRADPAPTVEQGRSLMWSLGPVAAEKSQTVEVVIRPTRKGRYDLRASAETDDGLRAEQKAELTADTAGLKASLEVPPAVAVGDAATVKVAVRNPGAVPLDGVTAWLSFDDGLTSAAGKNPAELPVGTVPPGETKRVEFVLTPSKAGRFAVRANVTADGGLADRAEGSLDARKAALGVTVTGPDKVALGTEGVWEVRVSNIGDVAVPNVTARATLPKSLTARGGSNGGKAALADVVVWELGTLAAGEKKTVRLSASADRIGVDGVITASAVGETSSGPGLRATAETPVAVAGQPAVVLELTDPPAAVAVGRRATLKVTVRNRGSGPAKNVDVSATVSAEHAVLGGNGPSREAGRVDGDRVTFPPIAELPAGASAVFTVDLEAAKPGAARFQAEVRADHLSQPLRDEQAGRVTAGP